MHQSPGSSLASIAYLLQSTSSPAPSARHSALVHQRTLSLLRLQRSLRSLTLQRDALGARLAAHTTAVEDSLTASGAAGKSTRKASRGAGGKKDTEGPFIETYERTVAAFEKAWEESIRAFEASEVLEGTPKSWVEDLADAQVGGTVSELLETLLADPYTLGAGIATLEGTALTSLIPSASTSGDVPPLETLLKLITALRGSEGVLQLALGIFDTATREIVGRESSAHQQQARFGVGLGIGLGADLAEETKWTAPPPTPGGQAREKELETFLVELLELLDGLALFVSPQSSVSTTSFSSASTGPLSLHHGVEDILLGVLHSARALRMQSSPKQPHFVSPTASPHASPTVPSSSTFSPATWSSTMTTTLSSLSAYPIAGLSTLANGAATVTGIALPSSPLPRPPSTPPPAVPAHQDPPPVPPKPLSPPMNFPAFIPSSPSQFLSPPKPTSPLASLLSRSAASLLRTLAPSAGSMMPVPLPQALISRLLSTSFPLIPSSTEGSLAHRKTLLLAVVRWWAFGWLGRKLGRAAYGGSWTPALVPFGVELSVDDSEGNVGVSPSAGLSAGTALLDEVYISNSETVEVMLGLHRTIYAAMVAACGLSGSNFDEKHSTMEGDRDKRALAKAARALVAAWAESGGSSTNSSPCSPRASLSATSLSSDEYLTLVDSFAPIVLHKPASSPRPPPSPVSRRGQGSSSYTATSPPASFKRSSAFGSNSSPQVGGGEFGDTDNARWRAAKDRPLKASLMERVEMVQVLLQDMPTRGEEDLGVFYSTSSAEPSARYTISTTLPTLSPLSPQAPPPSQPAPRTTSSTASERHATDSPVVSTPKATRAPFMRTHSSPVLLNSSDLASGLISPPHSPRGEALKLSMEARALGYFASQQAAPALSPGLSALTAEDPFVVAKANPSAPQEPTSAEVELLRRGIFTLARSAAAPRGKNRVAPPLEREVMDFLEAAALLAAAERDYPAHTLFSQTLSILQHYQRLSPDLSSLLDEVLDPLRRAYERRRKEKRLMGARLEELDMQRQQLLETSRSERGLMNDLRVRAWYSSIKGSQLGRQLRNRLAEVHGARTPFEREHARNSVEAWRQELGVHSFTKADNSTFDESLMLVETTVALSTQPSTFYASPYWSREQTVVATLLSQRAQDTTARPSLASSLLASGSSLLAAPLSLAGLPYPSSTQPTEPIRSPVPFDVVLSFGAASPSLLKAQEASLPFAGAVEDHLLRVQLKLSSYLWSDLSSSVISPRNGDGCLIGCDRWFEEFASPLSPLPRPDLSEVQPGVKAVPKAYLPTTPPPSKYLVNLVTRFSRHPSPHAKLHALLELELVLAATLSAPASAQNNHRPAAPSLDRGKDHLVQLTGLLQSRAKRTSLTISPLDQLLEEKDGPGDGADGDKPPSLSDNPRRRSVSRPLSLASSTSELPSLLPSLLDFSSSSSTALDSPAPTAGLFANTDELLLTLESLLLHTLPHTPALFQSLQVVASLTPASLLDCHALGKAFWDVAGAALSIKREVIEGEFGVVERGVKALSEGTTEGRELAGRLIRIAAGEGSAVALDLLGSMTAR